MDKPSLLISANRAFARSLQRAVKEAPLTDAFAFWSPDPLVAIEPPRTISELEQWPGFALCALHAEAEDGSKPLSLVEELRRDLRVLSPIIVLSCRSREALVAQCKAVGSDVVGSYIVSLPCRLEHLAAVIREAEPMPNEDALNNVIRRHCRFEQAIRSQLHDLSNGFGIGSDGLVKQSLHRLQVLELASEPPLQVALQRLQELFVGDTIPKGDKVELAISAVGAAVNVDERTPPLSLTLTVNASDPPPVDWRSLLIVDDDGYSSATVGALKAKGYSPRPVVRTLEEALDELEADPPDVLLCDYRLEGDPQKGLDLIRRALSNDDVRLVILISAEAIPFGQAPRGVATLDGLAKFDAERVHALITQAARDRSDPRT